MPVIGMVIILCLAAGCTTLTSVKTGDFGSGNSENNGGSGGSAGKTSSSVGESGTETWQATVSLAETRHVSKSQTRVSDPASGEQDVLQSSMGFQGTFPVTVHHEKSYEGKDIYYPELSPEDGYPVSGSYQSSEQIDSYGQDTGVHPMAHERLTEERTGTIGKTDFDFRIEGNDGFIQLDNSYPQTISQTYVYSEPEYNGKDSSVQNGGVWYQCNSDPKESDEFSGGTRDFRRDGARYVFTCKVTKNTEFRSSGDIHYDPSSVETTDVTMKVTLDPDYVKGSPTKVVTQKPTTKETIELATLVPLSTTPEPLAPLVTDTPEPLASLVPKK
jgi:hypothetical protein